MESFLSIILSYTFYSSFILFYIDRYYGSFKDNTMKLLSETELSADVIATNFSCSKSW